MLRQELPADLFLAVDIGLGRLALRLQRIEVLLKPLLGRFARIDGASNDGRSVFCRPVLLAQAVTHRAAP